jgi:hypothetical protein
MSQIDMVLLRAIVFILVLSRGNSFLHISNLWDTISSPILKSPAKSTLNVSYGSQDMLDANNLHREKTKYLRGCDNAAPSYITSYQGTIQGTADCKTDFFRWYIDEDNFPFSIKSIYIMIQDLYMITAQLQIADGALMRYQCNSCKLQSPPPPFYVPYGSGAIELKLAGQTSSEFSDSNYPANYFKLFYIVIPEDMNNVPSTYLNFDVTLTMGYGTVSPLEVGNVVPAFSNFTWRIDKSEKNTAIADNSPYSFVSNSDPLLVSLSNFQFNSGCDINIHIFDSLANDESKRIFSGCTMPDTWLVAPSGQLTITISTGATSSSSSMSITWFGVDERRYGCGSKNSLDQRYDVSMMLDDGSYSADPMKTGIELIDGCRWGISPRPVNNIVVKAVTLYITRISLKEGSYVRVYDGIDSSSGTILWRTDRITDTETISPDTVIVPPPLISNSGNMYVHYHTNNFGSIETGWAGEYNTDYQGSVGMGSQETVLRSNTVLKISPPGDGISYPTTSVEDSTKFKYIWRVEPARTAVTTHNITFVFSELNLTDCRAFVNIYDGPYESSPLLGTFCGNAIPRQWYITTSHEALVVFEASSDANNIGTFVLSYFTDGRNYHCGFPSNLVAALDHSSMHITDGSQSNEDLYPEESCQWRIAPKSAESVYIFFGRFDLLGAHVYIFTENGVGSEGKSLVASFGETVEVPPPVLVEASSILIKFNSTTTVTGRGFNLTYFSTTSGGNNTGPGHGPILVRSSVSYKIPIPVYVGGLVPRNTTMRWFIDPTSDSHSGGLYFILGNMAALDCTSNHTDMQIFTGDSISQANRIFSYCENVSLSSSAAVPNWIHTTDASASVLLTTNDAEMPSDDLIMGYYSDGGNSHCGIVANPAILTSTSHVLTDGTASDATEMDTDQYCEWIVDPYNRASDTLIILDIVHVDLGGGTLEVYDDESKTRLLWRCQDCTLQPRPIISSSGKLFVTFVTGSTTSGTGFRAIYSTVPSSIAWRNDVNGTVLESPPMSDGGLGIDSTNSNSTYAWHFPAVTGKTQVKVTPFYQYLAPETHNINVLDGRPAIDTNNAHLYSSRGTGWSCGNFVSEEDIDVYFQTLNTKDKIIANQYAAGYILGTEQDGSLEKPVINLFKASVASTDTTAQVNNVVQPASICKYVIDSGSPTQAFTVNVKNFYHGPGGASLQFYAGIYGNDAKIFDSRLPFTSEVYPMLHHAPCGRGILVVQANSSANSLDQAFHLDFEIENVADSQGWCQMYKDSLIPPKEDPDILGPILYATGILFAFVGLAFLALYIRRHWNDPPKKRKYKIIIPHPPYTPRLDAMRNRFLRRGECCVCRDNSMQVIRLNCSHKMCLEDLKGYLESALGDISVFPLKCPMHYEGCGGEITPGVAKRVIAQSQYSRFVEFTDRAIYGDGMRCIFCRNYVNFPAQEVISMVECPYCIQKFCIRCKKPWHYGGKCPLESYDDGLASWKAESGASCCPACKKIIEKDDPETCHHMVHKVTDSIPCIRERTDFCYLCGTEVAGDYPHIEIDNPLVNHFPDGVFQKCRKVVKKEKEAERDKLRKQRRSTLRQSSRGSPSPSRVVPDAPDLIGGWDNKDDFESPLMGVSSQPSAADRMWELMGSNSPVGSPSSPNLRRASPSR